MNPLNLFRLHLLHKKVTKPRVEKDLLPLLYIKAKESETSVEIEIDKILRKNLIKGAIHRCSQCHKAVSVIYNDKSGFCNNCDISVTTYET